MRRTSSRPRRLFGAPVLVALACLLAPPGPLAAQSSDGVAVEAQVASELARLDARLALGTFPDGSGPWIARLAAALERRGETVLAGALRDLGGDRALRAAADDPLHQAPETERLARLEAVAEGVRFVERALEAGTASWGPDEWPRATPGGRSDVDLSLGRLSGAISDRATGDGIAAFVSVSTEDGTFLDSVATDADGRFTVDGLPTGSYRLLVETRRHGSVLYGGVPCPAAACDRTGGLTVEVVAGVETAGLDVALEGLGSIRGTVTAEASGEPLEDVWIEVRGEDGFQAGTTLSTADGTYEVGSLPAGTYFPRASNIDTYERELYDDLPCPFWDCDPTTGTPVVVDAGAATTGIDFALGLLGSISGFAYERESGAPVWFGTVVAYDAQGVRRRSTELGFDGTYELIAMPTGSYTLRISAPGFQSQLWEGFACPTPCDPTDGTPVVVPAGTAVTDIDFPMARLGTVSGTVRFTLDDPALGIGSRVRVYRADGQFFGTRDLEEDGTYRLSGFEPGDYYVTTWTAAFRDQVYPGAPCVDGCELSDGVPVRVELDTDVTGIDFLLDRLGVIDVRATEADTGLFRPGVVEAYDAAGDLVRWRSVTAPGEVLTGLAPGSYYVRYGSDWSNGDTHQDELYPDIPCEPDCDVTRGTPVTVELNGPPVVLDMPLTACPGWTVADVSSNVGWYPVLYACHQLIARRSRLEDGESLILQSGRSVVLGEGFVVEAGASLVVEMVPEWAESSP